MHQFLKELDYGFHNVSETYYNVSLFCVNIFPEMMYNNAIRYMHQHERREPDDYYL